MTNLRYVTATLVVTLCGALALASCNKEKQGTEVPAGDDAAGGDAGAAEGEPGSDEPDATTGEVDHEAMTHGDAAEGGDAPADG